MERRRVVSQADSKNCYGKIQDHHRGQEEVDEWCYNAGHVGRDDDGESGVQD
jgi:hypothetical protein